MFLTPDELKQLTERERPSWQARQLAHLGIPFRRRSDGTLIVLREDVRMELGKTVSKREPQLRTA